MKIIGVSLVILVVACSWNWKGNDAFDIFSLGYDFKHPSSTIVLPDTLHEISGVTTIDSVTLACIQDENGVLFLYDLNTQNVKQFIEFHVDGDYEGLAKIDNDMYVLRSDGAIFEVSNFGTPNFTTTTHQTDIPAMNNEGFCYDKANNRLLIGCKGKLGKGAELKDIRCIYGFDLENKSLTEKPVYTFNVKDVKKYVAENEIAVPTKTKKNGEEPDIKFMISALAIHPLTNDLYILSAADHLLLVYNVNRELVHVESLDPKTFNKAEGLTFLKDGSLYISNEGQENHPTLLQFHYNKKHQ